MKFAEWFGDVFSDPAVAPAVAPPKPRLVVVNRAPAREEFAAWRDDPVTQFVFAALRAAQANQKAAWDEMSWVAGEADEMALCEYRTRADAYAGMEDADYDGFCEWAGVEPQQ